MGSALWKHLGTNPCSTPRLHWLHLYTTEQQPGTALMTLAVLQEKAVVFVHLILQHHQSSPTSSSPMTPKRQCKASPSVLSNLNNTEKSNPLQKTRDPAAFRAPWFRFATLFSDDCVPVVAFDALVLRSPNLELCSRPNGPFDDHPIDCLEPAPKKNTQNHGEILVIIIHVQTAIGYIICICIFIYIYICLDVYVYIYMYICMYILQYST